MKARSLLIVIASLIYLSAAGQCSEWDKFITNPHISIFDTSCDRFGNVYAVGAFFEEVQIGNVHLTGTPDVNGFIIKFDKNNLAVWGKTVANGQNAILKVKIDTADYIVVAGYYYSSFIDWDCIRLTNSSSRGETYVAKLEPGGKTIWAKNFVGADDEYIRSLAIGHDNSIVCSGDFVSNSLAFDSVVITNTGGYDAFVTMLREDGSVIWAKGVGGTYGNLPDYIMSCAIDSSNNTIIGGWFESDHLKIDNFQFDATEISANYFIAKIDAKGKTLWAKGPEAILNYGVNAVTVGESDNIYVSGFYTQAPTKFDGIEVNNSGEDDAFVVKYDPNGAVLWAKGIGGKGWENIWSTGFDNRGYLYISGTFSSDTITFGTQKFGSVGFADLFLSKMDTDGNILCTKRTYGTAVPTSLSIDPEKNVYLTIDPMDAQISFDNVISQIDSNLFSYAVRLGSNDNFQSGNPGTQLPTISLGTDTTLCNNPIRLSVGTFCSATYLWSTHDTGASITVSTPGQYWVDVFYDNVHLRDTINISYPPISAVDLGRDSTLCVGQQLKLKVGPYCGATYHWSTNDAGNSIVVTQAGKYWVDVYVNNAHRRDTIQISYLAAPLFTLGTDVKKCPVDAILFDLSQISGSILWSDGTSDFQKQVIDPGKYWVSAENRCGKTTDSVSVMNFSPLKLDLGADRTACDPFVISLDASDPNVTYLWNDGSLKSQKEISEPGKYWTVAKNQCESVSDTIQVTFIDLTKMFFPNVITPNGDGKNDVYILDESLKGSIFEVLNRWGEQVFFSPDYQNNWNGGDLSPGTYFFFVETGCKEEKIKGALTILR